MAACNFVRHFILHNWHDFRQSAVQIVCFRPHLPPPPTSILISLHRPPPFSPPSTAHLHPHLPPPPTSILTSLHRPPPFSPPSTSFPPVLSSLLRAVCPSGNTRLLLVLVCAQRDVCRSNTGAGHQCVLQDSCEWEGRGEEGRGGVGGEGVQRVLKHRCKGVECLMEEWSVLCAPLSKHYGTAVSV